MKEIFQYHHDSKHHTDRYARSPGYLDWENQPNPFRFYSGTAPLRLPLLKEDPAASHPDLYLRQRNQPQPFELKNVAGFLELSLGLSAWKAVSGNKWSLRINPSSGNLHPTEAYLLLPEMDALKSGLYHYNPFLHALELRCFLPDEIWEKVGQHFKTKSFFVALSSIFWRESWKYGERAFRYCNHDIGHALACLSFSGNLFGWKVTCLNELSDRQLETVLGFDRTIYADMENEQAELMCVVYDRRVEDVPRGLTDETAALLATSAFAGTPNRLSRSAINWEGIYRAADATRKPRTETRRFRYGCREDFQTEISKLSAAAIIRKRRSAVAFDPAGSLSREQFLAMLDKTVARDGRAPFDMEISEPCLNLLIFVHAVRDLEMGLYLFLRAENDLQEFKNRLKSGFLWLPAADGFPLYLLEEKNYRRDAKIISCVQDIAGDSAFSMGMISRFRAVVEKESFRYRRLFWEAGMIGQVLYLEAEAAGFRGTGIGCYFDDEVHAVMGLETDHYQSLYHFTVGKPVEDRRLQTLGPYHHLEPQ
ncbi:MAG: SagB/ThcOx family dehydrogenase [Thermodesulfobacteriota bacterium]